MTSEEENKFTVTKVTEYSYNGDSSLDVWGRDVGDGYHTILPLYEHRHRLYLALIKAYDYWITPLGAPNVKCWKSKMNDDGSTYEGWFLLGMTITRPPFFVDETPVEVFDISYHLPLKYWETAKVLELERAPKFTGYTSNDVLERLLKL